MRKYKNRSLFVLKIVSVLSLAYVVYALTPVWIPNVTDAFTHILATVAILGATFIGLFLLLLIYACAIDPILKPLWNKAVYADKNFITQEQTKLVKQREARLKRDNEVKKILAKDGIDFSTIEAMLEALSKTDK